jgi:hypothetical protein
VVRGRRKPRRVNVTTVKMLGIIQRIAGHQGEVLKEKVQSKRRREIRVKRKMLPLR